MNQQQLQLLACQRAYMQNEPLERSFYLSPEQWEDLHTMAAAHKLTAVVHEMMRTIPEFCKDAPELKVRWKRETICQSICQTAQTHRILEIVQGLEAAGISYAVVKGIVCRSLYGQPDLRPSGDEDILIRAVDRKRAETVLESFGLQLLNGETEENVAHWLDGRTGLHIELHQRLLPGDWKMAQILEPYFSRILDCCIQISVEGKYVRTLDPTAHFLFLIVHALKHFIAGGFGIRTLADVLMFARIHSNEIDHEKALELLNQIHGRVFWEQMMAIGEKYLAFSPTELGWYIREKRDYEPMLLDMLDAGVYGQTSMDRRHSAAMVIQGAKGHKRGNLRGMLFPSVEDLSGRYPELKTRPELLPVVWGKRMGHYALEILRDGNNGSPARAVSMGVRRQAMMEYYGIFPSGNDVKN